MSWAYIKFISELSALKHLQLKKNYYVYQERKKYFNRKKILIFKSNVRRAYIFVNVPCYVFNAIIQQNLKVVFRKIYIDTKFKLCKFPHHPKGYCIMTR